jgi:hypothetical protein
MKKEILYNYLGTNGTILSPVFLEGIYSVRKVRLTAEEGKRLTKDYIYFYSTVLVSENELNEWKEV